MFQDLSLILLGGILELDSPYSALEEFLLGAMSTQNEKLDK